MLSVHEMGLFTLGEDLVQGQLTDDKVSLERLHLKGLDSSASLLCLDNMVQWLLCDFSQGCFQVVSGLWNAVFVGVSEVSRAEGNDVVQVEHVADLLVFYLEG